MANTRAHLWSETRLVFQLALDERLHALSDPTGMMDEATAALGRHLGVSQVGFGEIDEAQTHVTVHRDWNDGRIASVVGTWRMDDFGPRFVARMKTGETIAIADVREDRLTSDVQVLAAYDTLQTRAILDVPLVREGRMVAMLFTHHAEPRCWSDDDVALVEAVGRRLWSVVERARAETRLRESNGALARNQRTLDALVRASSEVLFRVDADWSTLHQLSGGSFLSDSVADNSNWLDRYIPPEDHPAVHMEIARAIAARSSYLIEHRVIRADGSIGWAQSRAIPLLDEAGHITEWLGAASDITERRRAEADVRESATRLRLAVEAGQIGEWELNIATNSSIRALQHDRIFGYDKPIADWGIDTFLGHVLPEDQVHTEAAFRQAAASGTGWKFQCRIRRRNDNEIRWIAAYSAPQLDEAGRVVKLFGMVQDITDQKAAEIGLREMNETLEQRVADELANRSHVEEQLRQAQKMEAVGQLTGGLAHDFNNLLAGISGSLELMQNRMQQGRIGEVERYIATAQGAAQRAAALTHRLLAFSRRQTLAPKPTDVNRLVTGMQELIQRTVGPGIRVEVAGLSGNWPTLVDPSQLENALLNLCINARDAMPDGGSITIETAHNWLDARTARQQDVSEGQYLLLSVTDTGTGMPPEVVERVFEPFFTTKPIGQGTGLGLSMIYGFTRQSGGQVRIQSKVGQGTTVCLYLPRHLGEIAADVDTSSAPAPARMEQGETVLVVDDEPTVRMLMTDILEDLGHAAIEAADSATGLRILQSDVRIDLLVTDVGLPGGMNGRQMADAARVARPDLKVLFITGYAENAVLGSGQLESGMTVLTKPFAVEAMARRIQSMIEAGKEQTHHSW